MASPYRAQCYFGAICVELATALGDGLQVVDEQWGDHDGECGDGNPVATAALYPPRNCRKPDPLADVVVWLWAESRPGSQTEKCLPRVDSLDPCHCARSVSPSRGTCVPDCVPRAFSEPLDGIVVFPSTRPGVGAPRLL